MVGEPTRGARRIDRGQCAAGVQEHGRLVARLGDGGDECSAQLLWGDRLELGQRPGADDVSKLSGWLNARAAANMPVMSVTLEVSQLEMSALKLVEL